MTYDPIAADCVARIRVLIADRDDLLAALKRLVELASPTTLAAPFAYTEAIEQAQAVIARAEK